MELEPLINVVFFFPPGREIIALSNLSNDCEINLAFCVPRELSHRILAIWTHKKRTARCRAMNTLFRVVQIPVPHFLVMYLGEKMLPPPQSFLEFQWPHLEPQRTIVWICNKVYKTSGTEPGRWRAGLLKRSCFDRSFCMASSIFTFSWCVHGSVFPLSSTVTKKARPEQFWYFAVDSNSRASCAQQSGEIYC